MKNVCITGAAGFIGSHLAARFLSNGDLVFGIDDFSSSKRNSNHFEKLFSDRFEFHEISVENTDALMSKVRTHDFDLILNFACPASPPRYQSIPIKTLNTCFMGTKNMLQIAKMHSARMIHASTSEIYGDPIKSPQVESDWGNVNCFGERSVYDEGKRVAETLCYEYLKMGVDIRLIRIFNTYGPNMQLDDGRVMTNLISQAVRDEKLTVYGDGTQTRSFCYISDLVDGIYKLSVLNENPRQPINLGNPNEFTILSLIKHIERILKKDLTLEFKPLPCDDPRQRKPNITLANKLLDWVPKIELDEGLKSMIEYVKSV